MRTIGVLGGMSHVASTAYYRFLNEGVQARLGGHASAETVLYSVDFSVIERCISTDAWDEAAKHLADRAGRVEAAGAEFLLLATNTMHRVASEIQAGVGIPLVHIADVVAESGRAGGASSLGLLGTLPVMEAPFYRDRFAEHGVEVVVPGDADRALLHATIFGELTHGVFSEQTRQEYLRITRSLLDRGADGIVLGCTEIGSLLSTEHLAGVPTYDTTRLHVDRAVDIAVGDRPVPERYQG